MFAGVFCSGQTGNTWSLPVRRDRRWRIEPQMVFESLTIPDRADTAERTGLTVEDREGARRAPRRVRMVKALVEARFRRI